MFCGYVIFLIFGLFLSRVYSVGASEGNELLAQYSNDYITVVCIGSLGVFVQILTERFLQATGKSVLSMTVQLSGAIVNIVLDPILIFGLGPIPSMGVRGAAIATVAGQIVAAVIGIILNLAFNKEIKLAIKNFFPDPELLKAMLAIGIPSILMQAIGSLMTFCMNTVLSSFSIEALNVFGLYFKLQSFVFMPIFGLNNGMVPIIAYNYGAQKKERVFATIRLSALTAVVYMLLGFIAFQTLPDVLLGFFDASEAMLIIGRKALRIISISFIFAGFSIVASSTCQALGKSIYSLLVSIGRQLVVLIPAAFLLSLSGNVNLVWLAFPIAEVVSFALCIYFLIRVLNKTFHNNKEAEQV
jgi:putative MATE family efflux protein